MNAHHAIEPKPIFEGSNVEALTGSSPSTGAAPAFEPIAKASSAGPDAELIAQAKLVEELSAREHEHFARDPDHLPKGDPEAIAWHEQADVLSEEFRAGIEKLASLPAATPAGLAAKASATLKMNAMFDHLREWQEVDLVRGLTEDAVRLGSAQDRPVSQPARKEFRLAQQPNVLERTPEAKLLLLNQQYERISAFDYAAYDAFDAAAHDTPEKERLEIAMAHADRMLSAVVSEAYAIPATTLRAVALKARIMSGQKHVWWDPQDGSQDADARFIIEDVLALAGLDRLRPRDFDFVDIMPGYAGPGRVVEERSLTTPAPPSDVGATTTPSRSQGEIEALGRRCWMLVKKAERVDMGGRSIKGLFENLEREAEAIRERVSYLHPTSIYDAMFCLTQASGDFDCLKNCELTDEETSRKEERINRLLYAVLRWMEATSGTRASSMFGDYSMPDNLDPAIRLRNGVGSSVKQAAA